MASVAAALLLVTGWGSAVASSVSSVFVTNTSSNPVPVNGTVTVSGTPSVNVGNLHTDTNGNLKVAEQGTPTVHVNNTDSNGNLKVAEQGTPNVNVQDFPSSQTVNGSVSVSNLPAAPTTVQIATGFLLMVPSDSREVIHVDDLSPYREATVYLNQVMNDHNPPPSPGLHCFARLTQSPLLVFDTFDTGASTFSVKTYDPAPPSISLICSNPTTVDINLNWLLTGRTG
jgi:hypothetical protein